jgi:hypothetical protein
MKRMVLGALALLALAAPAGAVSVVDCNDDAATASAQNIAEPWERNSKTFYNGNVRVAMLDTGGEPVCCSVHVLVLSPTGEDPDGVSGCHIVNNDGGMGFVGVDFAKLAGAYDPKKGLLISFPYELYNDGNPGKKGVARVRLNVKTGELKVEK